MTLTLEGPHGTITVPDSVLLEIATRAAEGVEGVRVRRKQSVDAESRVVRLELSAARGEPLATQGERVQETVAAALHATCAFKVKVELAFEELR